MQSVVIIGQIFVFEWVVAGLPSDLIGPTHGNHVIGNDHMAVWTGLNDQKQAYAFCRQAPLMPERTGIISIMM